MALTPQEAQELAQLEQEEALSQQQLQPVQSGLTPEEEQELALLEQEEAQFQQQAAPQENQAIQAGIEGFGQAATLGFLPQIQAGVQKAAEFVGIDPTSGVDEELVAQGFDIQSDPETYTQARDAFIRRNQRLAEQHPVASGVGQVAGALTSGAALGGAGAVAKGAGLAKRVGTAARTGGLIGLLENPGDTEGVVDPLQIKERLEGGVKSALLGAATAGAVESVGGAAKVIKNLPKNVKSMSELKAIKASGAMLRDFRKLFDRKKVEKTGRLLLDKNLVQVGDDVEKIAKKVSALRSETGEQLGNIYSKVNDELLDRKIIDKMSKRQVAKMQDTALNMPDIARDLKKSIGVTLKGKPGAKAVLNRVDDELETLAANGNNLNIKEVHEIRRGFDDLINFDKSSIDTPLLQQQYKQIRTELNRRIQKRLDFFDDVFGSQKARELKKLNEEFSILADVDRIARDRIARDNANAAFGLRERISGGAGLIAGTTAGGPVGGLALGVASAFATKALRKYGNAASASIGNKVAKALSRKPSRFGEAGFKLIEAARQSPQQYMITLKELMVDPEFKSDINKLNKK